MIEDTLILIKPSAVKRKLVGQIIQRFENKNLTIKGIKILNITLDQAKEHYKEHEGKDFFANLVSYLTSSPTIAIVLEGEEAIKICRLLAGATNPLESQPGTIRGDFSLSSTYNVVHSSDSLQSAKREIKIFFKEEELVFYN